MKLWKSAWCRAAAMALVSVLLGGFLIYLYVPFFPFSTAKIFYYSMWDLEDEKQMKDWQRVPWDFGGFGTVNPQNPWTRYKVVYVKKGSIRPLSYWQRLEPLYADNLREIRYVPYSVWDAGRNWIRFQSFLNDEAYAQYSFRFTGNLELDDELGWRIFLIVDGRDAAFIREELTRQYGDFIVFDHPDYPKAYFQESVELLVMDPKKYMEVPSPGYVG